MVYSEKPTLNIVGGSSSRAALVIQLTFIKIRPNDVPHGNMSSFFDRDNKGIAVFLLIAFGLAWVLWEITIMIGPSTRDPLFQLAILPGALSPAVAAFIVRKWVTREGFSDAGLRLNRHHWRYYLAAWSLPLLVVTMIVLLATTLDISDPDFSMKRAIWQLGPPGTVAPPLPDGIFALVVFQSMIIALLATPILLGEEFGWRGYLQLRLLADRPLAAAVATGVIWSLWHLPLNLRGYNFPDQPILGMLVFTVSAIMLSIIFGWLRTKTGSIWSASLGHSATNAIGGNLTLLLFIGAPNWILVSYVGILAWIPLAILCAWIILTGQLKAT